MTRLTLLTVLVASFGAACTDDTTTPETPDNKPPDGSTIGSEDQTFDHDNSTVDPWTLIEQLAKEGPRKYTSRMHYCQKPRYRTFGNVLASLGVNMNNQAVDSPADLYRDGFNAMGGPNYPNRIRENLGITTSGASRAFDIFAAASQEIINAVPTLQRCQVNGQPAVLFDGDSCRLDGITCLIGRPASLAHAEFCTLTVSNATNRDIGKRIAVAALLAAAYTCE